VQQINTKPLTLQQHENLEASMKLKGGRPLSSGSFAVHRKTCAEEKTFSEWFAHFMSLSVAMCILVSPKLIHNHSQYAQFY